MPCQDALKVGNVVIISCGWTEAQVVITRVETKEGETIAYYRPPGSERERIYKP